MVETYEREKCFVISTYKDAYLDANTIRVDNRSGVLETSEHVIWNGYATSYRSYYNLRSSCYKLFDIQILRNNNIYFNETITHGEDGLFVCRYLQNIKELYYLPKQLWVILNRPNSASRSQFNSAQLSMFQAIDQMIAISKTEEDKEYFTCYKSERAYYFGWRFIISKNRDPIITRKMERILKDNAHKFIFGKAKPAMENKISFYARMVCFPLKCMNCR